MNRRSQQRDWHLKRARGGVNGNDVLRHRISYDTLRESDFFAAFGVHEVSRHACADGLATRIVVEPGSCRNEIELRFEVRPDGSIRSAELELRRGFIEAAGRGINALAVDIATSFIVTLTPAPDAERAAPHVERLRMAQNAVTATRMRAELLDADRVAATFVGAIARAHAPMRYADLSVENRSGDDPWLLVKLDVH